MKMQGFVFLEVSKAWSFCKQKEISKPQRDSDASLHFQEGIKRICTANPVAVT